MKAVLNNIVKALDEFNEKKERIAELTKQNAKLESMIETLSNMEVSDNIGNAIRNLKNEIALNNEYINEYSARINEIPDVVTRLYDDTRDYKKELRIDAMNTFNTMISNATSDYINGYSFEVFNRQNVRANEWLEKRMKELDAIMDNGHAFAFMINHGYGILE